MNKKRMLKRLKNKTHKLWRQCVLLEFDGQCVVCGDTKLPNCHHIVSEHLFTFMRYDVENGVVLCPSHHKFNKFSAHKNALWFTQIILFRIVSDKIMQFLLHKMEKKEFHNFIWTIESYENKLVELQGRLEDLKNAKKDRRS